MHLTLRRLISDETVGTFGILEGAGLRLWTVELPWRDNRRNVSCIPGGTYRCRVHWAPTLERWVLLLEGVPRRTEICVHSGNTIRDLLGCIAPGLGLGIVHGRWAVTSSKAAMVDLLDAVRGASDIILEVSEVPDGR